MPPFFCELTMAEGKYELGKTHRYRQSGPHRQLEDHRRHRRSAGEGAAKILTTIKIG
jgi:hypothetical protein